MYEFENMVIKNCYLLRSILSW